MTASNKQGVLAFAIYLGQRPDQVPRVTADTGSLAHGGRVVDADPDLARPLVL
jgi:hypothetical protein